MMAMPHRKNRRSRRSAFPDREIIAKAEGRFAKADKQRANIKANPKRAVTRKNACAISKGPSQRRKEPEAMLRQATLTS